MMRKYLSTLLILWTAVSASNYLTNGDFEEPLPSGWLQYGAGVIIRGVNYDPDPDYEVFLYRTNPSGYAELCQAADIQTVDLEFSVSAKLYASSNSSACWAGAAVIISYLDSLNSYLGETMICYRSPACPWNNNDTCHVIPVVDTLWNDYAFNINDELTNIPGINPSHITKIRVSLLARCASG